MNEGCWGKSTLPFRHKCVQQLRGTRKGGTFVGAQCRLCFCRTFYSTDVGGGKDKGKVCSALRQAQDFQFIVRNTLLLCAFGIYFNREGTSG